MEEPVINKSHLMAAPGACTIGLLTAVANAAVLPLEDRLETSPGSGSSFPTTILTWASRGQPVLISEVPMRVGTTRPHGRPVCRSAV
jgi:hypothetical protein